MSTEDGKGLPLTEMDRIRSVVMCMREGIAIERIAEAMHVPVSEVHRLLLRSDTVPVDSLGPMRQPRTESENLNAFHEVAAYDPDSEEESAS